jgi:two-component system chemotaxis response regulator CheB
MAETTVRRDHVVVGGSAGAVEAFIRLTGLLPKNLPASVFVVIHVSALYRSHLPEILDRRGPLPATHARDREQPKPGHVYVAPPDAHLLLEDGEIRLSHGPRENSVRPAIDPLFRSAAHAFKSRVVGVILSGTLDDGSLGLLDVKAHGGLTLVQDPNDATYAEMPRNAIESCNPHHVATIPELAALVAEAVLPRVHDIGAEETQGGFEQELVGLKGLDWPPGATSLTCPDCGGVLYLEGPGALKLRCQVGHSYAPESLFDSQAHWVESTLWAAHRSLLEQKTLAQHIADRADRRGNHLVARLFRRRQSEAQNNADSLNRLLTARRTVGGIAAEEEKEEPA